MVKSLWKSPARECGIYSAPVSKRNKFRTPNVIRETFLKRFDYNIRRANRPICIRVRILYV